MSTGRYLLLLNPDCVVPPEPSPSSPSLLRPQHWTPPPTRAQVWNQPTEMSVTLVSGAVPADGPVRGCVLVTATDLSAARRLAASCPVGPVVVVPMRDGDG